MLPPGHIAAGYLAAAALLKIAKPDLDPQQIHALLALGAFFGFAPDLDVFVSFAKAKRFTVPDPSLNHRYFWSHSPLPWLIPSLLIFFLASSPFLKYVGLIIWAGSWSHFLLDSLTFGIMWLWPLSRQHFALSKTEYDLMGTDGQKKFFQYWTTFLLNWFKTYKIGLSLELILIITALAVLIH
jgi:membrane-bound metal-dependent hydrolase YbcI (DUF457 family)